MDGDDLLSPLEQQIVELTSALSSAIARLCDGDDEPLAEFDQRLLLEHVQIVERFVLAQAAARAVPHRYRAIGHASPRPARGGDGIRRGDAAREPGAAAGGAVHAHDGPHRDHDHDLDHDHGSHGAETQHHVADADAAREAHRQGRAIIGEHPWEQGHDHSHDHPDEWAWEPLGDD